MEVSNNTQQPVSSATAAAGTSPTQPVISSDFETFLTMLTTQLENQDPLDPVQSEDFAVQLATFSSVEQQVLTNDLLEAMTAQLALSELGEFASWVGMEVRAPVAGFFDGDPITLAPSPEEVASSALLVVRNAADDVVQRVPVQAGAETLEWSGQLNDGSTAPTGLYEFSLESYVNGSLSSTTAVDVYTKVREASIEEGATILVTEGGATVAATSATGLRDSS